MDHHDLRQITTPLCENLDIRIIIKYINPYFFEAKNTSTMGLKDRPFPKISSLLFSLLVIGLNWRASGNDLRCFILVL